MTEELGVAILLAALCGIAMLAGWQGAAFFFGFLLLLRIML